MQVLWVVVLILCSGMFLMLWACAVTAKRTDQAMEDYFEKRQHLREEQEKTPEEAKFPF